MSEVIKTRIAPNFKLEIDMEDGQPPKVWRLCYTYKAIAKVEEATGLDLKRFQDWDKISSGKHFPAIVHGGLERFNPEVTLQDVTDVLNPEAQKHLSDAIFDLMFPGARDMYAKLMQDKETGATASPNVVTETPKL
ncbi:MAG: hypothetical protein WCC37_25960 [Candidatus Sulfotelmatobacter sp.]